MHFTNEQARKQSKTADALIRQTFGEQAGALDAEFFTAKRDRALGLSGLPFPMPVCAHLMNHPTVAAFLDSAPGSRLFRLDGGTFHHLTEEGETELPAAVKEAVQAIYRCVLESPGLLNEKGELLLDLKNYPVGPHYPVNLLLGSRAGYPYPLCTTPKSALDALGARFLPRYRRAAGAGNPLHPSIRGKRRACQPSILLG